MVDILEGCWERDDLALTNILLSSGALKDWIAILDEEAGSRGDWSCNWHCSETGALKLFANVAIEA